LAAAGRVGSIELLGSPVNKQVSGLGPYELGATYGGQASSSS